MSTTKALNDVLNKLRIKGETGKLAEEIFRKASHLTRPGSAYAITEGPQVLPAACLYIASLRLGNNDITKEVARNVACVDLKVFEKAQLSIERALSSQSSPIKPKKNSITFQSLIQQYDGREDAHVPMVEVERALLQSKAVEDTSTPLYQGAIFSWVYINVFELPIPEEEFIRRQVHASSREWSLARRNIDKCCSGIKPTLISQAQAALSRLRRSRSCKNLVPTMSSFPVTPSKTLRGTQITPSVSSGRIAAMKRKPSITNLIEEMSTPSKRPKAAALFPPLTDNKLSTPIKTVSPVKKVQGDEKVDSINNSNDEDEDIPHETIVIPRQPIISHLDGRESNPSPKKVLAVSCKSPSYASVCETPSKKIVSVAETPMTTTGMSDASSSPSGYLTEERQPSRRRVQSFPALRKNQLPLMVEEETTQWQRRNLRAAFLNHDVYGWKPSPMVSKKLKLAESWEKALIKSFGDPWDELLKTRSKSS